MQDTIEAFPELIARARRDIRWRRDGVPARGQSPLTRIFARCLPVGDCWEWQEAVSRQGYASIRQNGRMRRAHRVVWEQLYGPISDTSIFVCHTCDNPPCCNPEHLFLGTALDNNRDRHAKGRTVMPPPGPHSGIRQRERTHCIRGHEFTEQNTRRAKNGTRTCRACQSLRDEGRVR